MDSDSVIATACKRSALFWAEYKKLELATGKFNIKDHPYQVDILNCVDHARPKIKVYKKGAQMGFSELEVIDVLHGLRFHYYPQGALYLFPTADDVTDFSKGRFDPLISKNKEISDCIQNTDSATVKRINNAMLYFRSARPTKKIEGQKKTSSKLKTVPVDRIIYDEFDEMDSDMISLARERLAHSEIKHEDYLSTPSIPDFGIDKMYQNSDQRLWMIKCKHCGKETCLEMEFPACLEEAGDKHCIKICVHCGREIFTRDGRWIAQCPDKSKDIEGYWISQLNSHFVDPWTILDEFMNPPNGKIDEVYNSKLAQAYIAAENRLVPEDIWNRMGFDPMWMKHAGPTAMGVDVNNDFHITILDRPYDKTVRLIKACHVSSSKMKDWTPLYDLAKQYNVKCCVMDFAPAQKLVREFAEAVPFEVFGCIYQQHQRGSVNWDQKEKIVRVNRTEICDSTHDLFVNEGSFIAPRRSNEMNEFTKHMCNLVKVLEEDKNTGSQEYAYRKLGPDHYRHSLNYSYLAAGRIGLYVPPKPVAANKDAYAEEVVKPSGSWMGS